MLARIRLSPLFLAMLLIAGTAQAKGDSPFTTSGTPSEHSTPSGHISPGYVPKPADFLTLPLDGSICDLTGGSQGCNIDPASNGIIVTYKAARSKPGKALGALDVFGYCRYVDNSTPDLAYFVPFNSSTEWMDFRNNAHSANPLLNPVTCARPLTVTLRPDPSSCGSPSPASQDIKLPYARTGTKYTVTSNPFTCTTPGICNSCGCGAGQTWTQIVHASYTALNADLVPSDASSWDAGSIGYEGMPPAPSPAPTCSVSGTWELESHGTCTADCDSSCSALDTYACVGGPCAGTPPVTYTTVTGPACTASGTWELTSKGTCTPDCDSSCSAADTYTCVGGPCAGPAPTSSTTVTGPTCPTSVGCDGHGGCTRDDAPFCGDCAPNGDTWGVPGSTMDRHCSNGVVSDFPTTILHPSASCW